MSAVRAAAELGGLVDLDVPHLQGVSLDVLGLSVARSVGEEVQEHLGGLDGPAALHGVVALGLGAATDTAVEVADGDAVLRAKNVLQVSLGALQGHALDGLASLVHLLEVHAEVRATGLDDPAKRKEAFC